MPTITIVVPVYNVEKFLCKCLDSILNQTFTNYKVILVDDESTDSSGIICDEYAEKYEFISVIHQKNKGLGGARNTGIDCCDTEYIMFLDSDDYLHPEALSACMEIAVENDCDMVFYNLIAVDEDGNLGVEYDLSLPAHKLLTDSELMKLVYVSGACNRIFRTSLFKKQKICFPEKVWYEDLKTIPKLALDVKNAWYYNSHPLYFYLQRQGSIMHTPDLDRIVRERLGAINEIRNYYNEKGYAEKYKEELEYMYIFHGFFLPVREMQAVSGKFGKYADKLSEQLMKYCKEPLKNKYISTLSSKEQQMLKWFLGRKYTMVKALSSANKLLKGVKKCFRK